MNAALAGWTSSNGLTNTLAYDTDGRLTGISVPGVESLGYSYDASDRLTGINNTRDGTLSQDFGYDDQSRLVSMYSSNQGASYGYDADGNRITGVTSAGASNTSYSTASNRLVSTTGANPQSYGYDALGNITTLGGTTAYQYDAFNRMNAAGGMSYYVNPEGQRLRKTGGAGTTYFAPDASGTLLAEYANGAWVDYVWLGGRLIGREVSGQLEAIHDDQLGRPQVVTNASQAVVWSAQNWPFTRNVTVSSSAPLNLGFPGQYYDAETGLWNNGFRDYDPTLGRYVESDPLGLQGGVNTYTYAGGNPLSYTDPLGLDFLGKCLAQQYLDKYGADAWDKIRGDRDSAQPVIPGTNSEAMRNAEHYLYNYNNVQSNSYSWGTSLALTVGYETTKFWTNVGDYYGVVKSPWGYSVPTNDELESGLEGANDALFGNSSKSSCGCGDQ